MQICKDGIESGSDVELMKDIAQDDANAFKLLYDKYWKVLYIKACKGVDEEEAKDMIQDVLLSLWNRRHQIRIEKEKDLCNYLFTALKYRMISFYAYTAAKVRKETFLQLPEVFSPETLLENKELKMQLDAVVNEMPGKMQIIFRMSREEENSVANIAFSLNLSEQTVKNQLTNALKRLRNALSPVVYRRLIPTLLFLYLAFC